MSIKVSLNPYYLTPFLVELPWNILFAFFFRVFLFKSINLATSCTQTFRMAADIKEKQSTWKRTCIQLEVIVVVVRFPVLLHPPFFWIFVFGPILDNA